MTSEDGIVHVPLCATSGGEDFDPGPETRLDHWSFLCHRILLKYKREREKASDIDIRRGQKECPLASFFFFSLLVFSKVFYVC